MKYFVAIFLVVCGLQASFAYPYETRNWRRCVEVVLDGVAGTASHIAGVAEWQLEVIDTVINFEESFNACEKLARNDPPSNIDVIRVRTCKTREVSNFVEDITRLTNELMDLGEEAVEVANNFWQGIMSCNRRFF